MADTAVKLFGGTLPTTPTVAYTGKANTTCILKSIVICNFSSVTNYVSIRLSGNRYLVGGRPLKPYETLVVPVTDLVINPSETFEIWSGVNSGFVNARISAIERDGSPATLGLSPSRVTLNTGITSITTSASAKRLVKSFVITNYDGGTRTVTVRFGASGDANNLIGNYKISGYDTVLIPFADIILTSGEWVEGFADSSSVVVVHAVTQVVT